MSKTKYGRKKIREEKKPKVELVDKIRERVLTIKSQLESGEIESSYLHSSGLMKEFKESYGEVDKCLMELQREGLVSSEYGRTKYRHVIFDRDKVPNKPEPKTLEPTFSVENCPICDSKLEISISKFRHLSSDHVYECKNKCFIQKYGGAIELIYIYNDVFMIAANEHNSVKGDTRKRIERRIKYWKTNQRFVARNLLGVWEDE